jgi:hypothetical protein
MAGPAHALLRQRFGTPEEMTKHLHPVDNRILLFFRDPNLKLAGNSKVLLEISFITSEQQVVLRGQVLGAVDQGALRGLWLEFPDTRLSKRTAALRDRKQRRVACDALVQINSANHPHLGRLTDLSMGGARLSGASGVQEGDEVEIRIISDNAAWPSELGRAQIIRLNAQEVGAKFLRLESNSRMAINRLFGALQESWSTAPLVEHPGICCKGGPLVEPPIPRSATGRGSSPGTPR